MSKPPLVAAAHGTRSAAGLDTVRAVMAGARVARPNVEILECYVDVASPSLADIVAGRAERLVVVPMLLSGGYHVRVDIPAVIAGRTGDTVTKPLGPDPRLAVALTQRLTEARGARPVAGSTVLAWAGSSDPAARDDVGRASAQLGRVTGRPTVPAVVSGDGRGLAEAVRAADGDVEIATYLLAEGAFADRVRDQARDLGVATVGEPLGPHPAVVEVLLARYETAVAPGR